MQWTGPTHSEPADRTVWLRPLSFGDVDQLVAWDGDPTVAELMGRRFDGADGARAWLASMGPRRGRLGLAVLEGPTLLGDVELEHIVWRTGEAELRICLGDPGKWGRGLGTAAMQLVLAWAFGPLGLRRVYLRVAVDNRRAVRLYEKCGFARRAKLPSTGRLSQSRAVWLMDLTADRYGACSARPSAAAAGRASTVRA